MIYIISSLNKYFKNKVNNYVYLHPYIRTQRYIIHNNNYKTKNKK